MRSNQLEWGACLCGHVSVTTNTDSPDVSNHLMGSDCYGINDAAQRLLISCFIKMAVIWVTCTLLSIQAAAVTDCSNAHGNSKDSLCCFVRTKGMNVYGGSNEAMQQNYKPGDPETFKHSLWCRRGLKSVWPAGHECQTAPRRCRRCRHLQPDPPQWPGSRSSPPWSQWWKPAAWCHWLTAWCGHMSSSHAHKVYSY